MKALKKIAFILNIQPGEGSIFSLLLIYSFFIGFVQTLTLTTSTTLFLETFRADHLPYVYIISAFLLPVLGLLYGVAGKKPFLRFKPVITTGLLWLVLFFFWTTIDQGNNSRDIHLLLYVWYFVQNLFLININFWETANRLFDVRQAKRLFGLITVGEVSARILTGLSIKKLVQYFGGIHNLILPALLGLMVIMVLLFLLRDQKPDQVKKTKENQQKKFFDDLKMYPLMLRNPYVLLVLTASLFMITSYYFVDINYLTQANNRFTSETQLAEFIGLFSAASGLLTFLIGAIASGPLITRFGVMAGIVVLPLMTAAGVLLIILGTGYSSNPTSYIFSMSVLTKMLFMTFNDTTAKVSSKILLKPLLPTERHRAGVLKINILEPIFTGVVGFVLLMMPYSAIQYSHILLFIVLAWMVCIYFLRKEYKKMLKRALGLRVLGDTGFILEDAESKTTIQKGLNSEYAGEVIYMLALLDASVTEGEYDHEMIERLLHHPAWEVRKEIIQRIEKNEMTSMLPSVRELLEVEKHPQVRGAGLRLLSILGGENGVEEVQELVKKEGWEEREEAIVGQLRSGEIEGVLWGGGELLALQKSDDEQARLHAARIIGKAGIESFYRPLLKLMKDEHKSVRAESIKAAGKLANPHLWMALVELLSEDGLREMVVAAMADGGQAVVSTIEKIIDDDLAGKEEKKRLLKVCGRVKGEQSIVLLKNYMVVDDFSLANQALKALTQCEYRAIKEDAAAVKNRIIHDLGHIALTLAMIMDINEEENSVLLKRGLHQRIEYILENIFLLLMLIYDQDVISKAWNILQSGYTERRAYALEVLDETLGLEYKALLFPMIEAMPDSERFKRLSASFPQKKMRPEQRTQEIILSSKEIWSDWLKACSLWTLEHIRPEVYHYQLEILSKEDGASGFIRLLDRGEETMLSVIEKVIILKTVSIFSELPDEVLADIAPGLEEIVLEKRQKLFEKGDIGDSMYIIVSGKVRVHDGIKEIAERGEREIIGEMALLDPQPRSASVTAIDESMLLKLEQDVFFDLITDRIEVTRGVITMLTRRLREAVEK